MPAMKRKAVETSITVMFLFARESAVIALDRDGLT